MSTLFHSHPVKRWRAEALPHFSAPDGHIIANTLENTSSLCLDSGAKNPEYKNC
jgi:hypothetical protein